MLLISVIAVLFLLFMPRGFWAMLEINLLTKFYRDISILSQSFNCSLRKINTLLGKKGKSIQDARVLVYKPKLFPSQHVPSVGSDGDILFPETYLRRLDADELEFILAHELGHYFGCDDELEADAFAAELLGPEIGIKTLEHDINTDPDSFCSELDISRLNALRNFKPLS